MPGQKKVGEILLENGLIDKVQLDAALRRQKQWGGRLGANLVKLGYISEISLLRFLSEQLNFPCADLSKFKTNQEIFKLISIDIVKKYHIIPLQVKESAGRKSLFLAMSNPADINIIDEIDFITGCAIKPVIATDSQIESAINKYYLNKEGQIESLAEKAPVMSQEEIEIFHEVPLKERIKEEKIKNREIKTLELQALIMVLEEKGIITKDEFTKKLNKLMQKDSYQ